VTLKMDFQLQWMGRVSLLSSKEEDSAAGLVYKVKKKRKKENYLKKLRRIIEESLREFSGIHVGDFPRN